MVESPHTRLLDLVETVSDVATSDEETLATAWRFTVRGRQRGRPCHHVAWEAHEARVGPRRFRAVGDRRDTDLAADSRVAVGDPPGLDVCSAVVSSSPRGSGHRGSGSWARADAASSVSRRIS